jgi:hypothetical protein
MKHLLITTIAAVLLVWCGTGVDIGNGVKDGYVELVEAPYQIEDFNSSSNTDGKLLSKKF